VILIKTLVFAFIICSILFIAGCTLKEGSPSSIQPEVSSSKSNLPVQTNCIDGTPSEQCSTSKPNYCKNGVLKEDATNCGCPDGYRIQYGICVQIKKVDEKYCPHLTPVPSGGLEPGKYSDYELNSNILEQVNWDGWEWKNNSISFMNSNSWFYSSLLCNKGKNKGENVNYVYCDDVLDTLKKSFSDENGIVQTKAAYYMKWIYVPSGNDYALKEILYYDNFMDQDPVCTTPYQ